MSVTSPNFITKVLLPQRRTDVLRRPRLLEFLHQHVDRRLLLVCAPAGYGKSTLLVDFSHEVEIPVCWYALGASDSDVRVFLEYLIAAIHQRYPAFGDQTRAVLQTTVDLTKGLSAVVGTLVSEMYTAIPEYFILVLDDFHNVDASDQVPAAVDLLLHYLPENCHVVIASRNIPRLTLSRLAAHRHVAGLGTSDLRFTSDEIKQLLSEQYKVLLPGKTADALATETEGWITGIILGTHTLWQGLFESIIRAKGAGGEVFDYLASEVFDQQPPDIQRFLLATSVMEQLSPRLCAELSGAEDPAAKLLRLGEANLFITRLAGAEDWFRYHQLFRSFLQKKLREEQPSRYCALQRRAAELAIERQAWDEAISHYASAEDYEGAVRVIVAHSSELIDAGKLPTLARWIDSLPEAVVSGNPQLLLIRGRIHIKSGEPDRGIELLDDALGRFVAADDRFNAARALSVRSVGLALKGRGEDAVADCERAIVLVGSLDRQLAAEVHRNLGVCHSMQGRFADGIRALEQALQLARGSKDQYAIATLHQSIGFASARLGEVARARHHLNEALSIWRRLDNVAACSETLNSLGYLLHDDGEEEAALATLTEGLSKARDGNYLRIEAATLANIADVYRCQLRYPEAIAHYEHSLEIARRIDEGYQVGYALDGLGDTYALLGEHRKADRLLRQALLQAEERQSAFECGNYETSLGMLKCDQGESQKALRILTRACEHLEASGAKRELTRAFIGRARALRQLDKGPEALAYLKQALEVGLEVDYQQFLVRDGARCLDVLKYAVEQAISDSRVQHALATLSHREPKALRQMKECPLQAVACDGLAPVQALALGQAKVLRDGREITRSAWASDKVRELFFFLLGHGYSLSKEQIVESLWPDLPPGSYNSTFHSTMYRLRRALREEYIVHREGRYRINPEARCYYDVSEFESLLAEADRLPEHSGEAAARYERAVALYQGPYLKEFSAEWCEARRARLATKQINALLKLAAIDARSGQHVRAVELCLEVLNSDNMREEGHCLLLKCYLALGDYTEGLRHYRRYVNYLHEELGVAPASSLRAVYEQLLRGEPATSSSA